MDERTSTEYCVRRRVNRARRVALTVCRMYVCLLSGVSGLAFLGLDCLLGLSCPVLCVVMCEYVRVCVYACMYEVYSAVLRCVCLRRCVGEFCAGANVSGVCVLRCLFSFVCS